MKKTMPRCIIMKLLKINGEDRILKATRENVHTTDREAKIRMRDFLLEIKQVRRNGAKSLKNQKIKNCQPRILSQVKCLS